MRLRLSYFALSPVYLLMCSLPGSSCSYLYLSTSFTTFFSLLTSPYTVSLLAPCLSKRAFYLSASTFKTFVTFPLFTTSRLPPVFPIIVFPPALLIPCVERAEGKKESLR